MQNVLNIKTMKIISEKEHSQQQLSRISKRKK